MFSCNSGGADAKDNLSAVLCGINDLRLEQRPVPKPRDHRKYLSPNKPSQCTPTLEVLLQMESVGICGSDVHFLVHGKIGPFVVTDPMIIGHEASGTVVEIGKKVKTLKPGDRVAIEPGVGCRMCSYCKEGRYHLCPDMAFCATPPIDGNLSRFFAHDEDFCFKLPDHLTYDEGALMEPLAVAVHSLKQANFRLGQVLLVMGAGPIGLVTMLAGKAIGASAVLVTDTEDFRLKKAKDFGADCVYQMCEDKPEDEIVQEIKEELGCEPHATIDCAGAVQAIRISLKVTRTGGVVVLTGMGQLEMNIPLTSAIFREVDIKGVFRYNNDYPMAIDMVASGRANVKPLVTHHFKIEDTVKAFETAKTREGNPIKIMIHPNPNWQHCL
ncbi:hypothetical protein Zmor_000521 [Zophobas morio]|uniref:Sorbitol dehydrogenase n=1 Tax=Zophobas morio TaxID=2755281 RepID=A0AA38J0Y8_9CUCU|nr:hypothetical protein Zmor_000521 [Zophobas morio]